MGHWDWIAKYWDLDLERFGGVRHGVLTMFNAVCVIIYAICATRFDCWWENGWKKKYQWLCLEKKRNRELPFDEVVWRMCCSLQPE